MASTANQSASRQGHYDMHDLLPRARRRLAVLAAFFLVGLVTAPALPPVLVVLALGVRPPHPRRWVLVAANAFALVLVVLP